MTFVSLWGIMSYLINMTERTANLDQARENLNLGLAALEQKYPQVVEIIEDRIREGYMNKVELEEIPGGEGASFPVEREGEIEPYRNFYFNPELTTEDRISNLFFFAQSRLRRMPYKKNDDLVSVVKNLISKKAEEETLKKNIQLADAMRDWTEKTNTKMIKEGAFNEDTRTNLGATGAVFLIDESLRRYEGEVPANHWLDFIADEAKVVFQALENGMSAKEIIEILKRKDYLIPFIGSEKKYTIQEAIALAKS